MKCSLKKFKIIIFLLFIGSLYNAQTPDYINGIMLYNPQQNNHSPIITKGEQLILKFDDLRNNYTRYQYTIVHCNYDWTPSDAFQNDYLKGFKTNFLAQFSSSLNTIQAYKHYSLTFPNDKIQLKISGNYILKIFETDPNKPIITKRFIVVEPLTSLQLRQVKTKQNLSNTQQLEAQVQYNAQQVDLLRNNANVYLTILKNNNFKDLITVKTPDFQQNNQLIYNSIKLNFKAGNEYRWVDTKTRETGSFTTLKVIKDSISGTYTHYLQLDKDWSQMGYQNNFDYNGGFYIRTVDFQASHDIDNQAEYITISFALDSPKLTNPVYVIGAFNDWEPTEKYQMQYDEEEQLYYADILLKQGTYNYQYAVYQPDTKKYSLPFEGDYWQTTNSYQALLYYRPFGMRYDLVIGYANIQP